MSKKLLHKFLISDLQFIYLLKILKYLPTVDDSKQSSGQNIAAHFQTIKVIKDRHFIDKKSLNIF